MGAPQEEDASNDDERPQRRVTMPRPFALGRVAVTFAMWDAAVAAGFKLPRPAADPELDALLASAKWLPQRLERERPADERWGRIQRPVINVNWLNAKAYCAWLNRRLGLPQGTYRLPTEAEWEYSCRAGKITPFSFGENISRLQANYYAGAALDPAKRNEHRQGTVPVGSLPQNPWGLHEMHGNVWEWVEDVYGPYPVGSSDSRALVHPNPSRRVLRGGSWNLNSKALRSASRYGSSPGAGNGTIGFRLARTLGR